MTNESVALSSACRERPTSFEEREDGRFCHRCQKMQYDFRDATRREMLAVLARSGDRACGRVRIGPGGEPKFKPEPPSRTANAVRGAALALTLAACEGAEEPSPPPSTVAVADPPIDHSTDTSTDPDDHSGHAHAHDPVAVQLDEGRQDVFEGAIVRVRDPHPRHRPRPPSSTP